MRVALVHDWLVTYRGGEKVLDAMCEAFPDAEVFTLIHQPGTMSPRIESRPIHTSWLQQVPGIHTRYRHFLPLLPAAVATLKLPACDLVVSSSHCVAKGVPIPAGAKHLSYVHAPMRYMWDRFDDYFGPGRASLPVRAAARLVRPALQRWDVRSSRGIDRIFANSANIAQQISRVWHRDAQVLHPPVELDRFTRLDPLASGRGGYFLWLGALAPYKRVDVAIAAFARTGLPLWIAGSGQESLTGLPPNVRVLGQVPDSQVPELFWNARALVFPGEEDFGLTPIEAQACGRPVIALGRGGVLETTSPQTALYFDPADPDALAAALLDFQRFEAGFDPTEARRGALRFTREAFIQGLRSAAEALVSRPS